MEYPKTLANQAYSGPFWQTGNIFHFGSQSQCDEVVVNAGNANVKRVGHQIFFRLPGNLLEVDFIARDFGRRLEHQFEPLRTQNM